VTLRLLHTSDLHIEVAEDAACLVALGRIAAERRVDAVLIVGDFFDHNRVDAETLAATAAALAQLPAPAVVLPGNHDPAVAGSVYERADFGPRVHVLRDDGPDGAWLGLPELDAEFWGRPHTSYADMSPLADVPARGGARWQIGLAHGQVVRGRADQGRAYLIHPEQIAACQRDYLALGHWDVPGDASAGEVVAAYSGSFRRVGVAALATLSDGRPTTVARLAAGPGSG
jgi:DNA repair exonuclease SbcCD nuclease subunit